MVARKIKKKILEKLGNSKHIKNYKILNTHDYTKTNKYKKCLRKKWRIFRIYFAEVFRNCTGIKSADVAGTLFPRGKIIKFLQSIKFQFFHS